MLNQPTRRSKCEAWLSSIYDVFYDFMWKMLDATIVMDILLQESTKFGALSHTVLYLCCVLEGLWNTLKYKYVFDTNVELQKNEPKRALQFFRYSVPRCLLMMGQDSFVAFTCALFIYSTKLRPLHCTGSVVWRYAVFYNVFVAPLALLNKLHHRRCLTRQSLGYCFVTWFPGEGRGRGRILYSPFVSS